MKFSDEVGMVLSYTYKYIVTMDINKCGFYGNIFAILCQIFYIFLCNMKNI